MTYLLQIKDRHNGNILLEKKTGKIFHIDFGFLLSNAPGGKFEFEKPIPFKLLGDYMSVLGGERSFLFKNFKKYFFKGFKAARKHKDKILILTKMMFTSQ